MVFSQAFVRAIVWTTLVAFMWMAWQSRQAESSGISFSLSRLLNSILAAFKSLWVLTGLGLLVASAILLILVLQPSQVAAWTCKPNSVAVFPSGGYLSPMITVCGPAKLASSGAMEQWTIAKISFSVTPDTLVQAPLPSKPGQSVRADLIRDPNGQWQAMRLVPISP